jgi:hypothetical protein
MSVRASSAVSQQSVPVQVCSQHPYILAGHEGPGYLSSPRCIRSQCVLLTQLCPLELRQLRQSLNLASDLLHRLAALEARKSREVGVVLVDQVVVDERQFGVLTARFLDTSEQFVGGGSAEGGGRRHFAEFEVAGRFFVTGGFGAAARSLREVCQAGHCEG